MSRKWMNNKKGKGGDKGGKSSGQIRELRSYVYAYGVKTQQDQYVETTEEIADYVGRTLSNEMYELVKYSKEATFNEPTAPTGKNIPVGDLRKYEIELRRYYDMKDTYRSEKSKTFRIIKGQCTLTMKNKVESAPEYKTKEAESDVVWLLVDSLKSLAFTKSATQEDWMMQDALRELMTMTQGKRESLAGWYRRFDTQRGVVESRWGLLHPTKIAGEDEEVRVKKNAKLIACMFMAGVDQDRYGKAAIEHNNDFVITGNDNYPATMADAMQQLSNRSDVNQFREYDDDLGTSFAQRHRGSGSLEDVQCYKCREYGHYAVVCPEKKNKKNKKSKKMRDESDEEQVDDSSNSSDDSSEGSSHSDCSSRSQRTKARKGGSRTGWNG